MKKAQINKRFLGLGLLIVLAALLFGAGQPAQAGPEITLYQLYHPVFLKNYYLNNSIFSMVNGSPTPAQSVATLFPVNNYSGTPIQTLNPTGLGSRQGLSLRSQDMTITNWIYSLSATSDQPVETAINIYRAQGNLLSIYRGLPAAGATQLVIGPFYKDSGAILQNTGFSPANLNIWYYDQAGNAIPAYFQPVPPGGVINLLAFTNPAIPPDFKGMLMVSSDQPIIGLNVQRRLRGGLWLINGMSNALQSTAGATLPRLLKGVDEDGGPRSSRIFLGFPTLSTGVTANGTLIFLDAAGAEVTRTGFSLGANQSTEIALDDLADLAEGGAYAVRMESDQPVSINEITDYRTVSTSASAASYDSDAAAEFSLPRLVVDRDSHSTLSVVNTGPGTASLNVDFNDLGGAKLATRSASLPAGGWVRYDLRQIEELGGNFTGTAALDSGGTGAALKATVDEYYTPCLPVSNLLVERIPAGFIFTGNNVQFTVSASGTAPLSYQWTLDGQPLEASGGLWEHVFSTPGTSYVGVQVQNACGQASQTFDLTVLDPAAQGSDLSTSNMTPSLASVSAGSALEYTIVLRNTSLYPANATLVDPLPANLTYLVGSASDGGTVAWDGTNASWAGTVSAGSPVFITLSTTVQSIGVGLPLVNQAALTDGQGHTFPLWAHSTGVAGYSLLIEDGRLTTNTDKVTLRYSFDPNADIFYYRVSNDPGFAAGPQTSPWRAVDPADPTLNNWSLDVVRDLRMPSTVYIRFRSKDGIEFGPYQDEIIYDPQAPTIDQLSASAPGSARLHPASLTYLITARTSDLISGVSELQISLTPDFTSIVRNIPVTGLQTTFEWTPIGRPTFYLRAVDRSGNFSSPVGFLDQTLFIPSVRR